MPPRYSSRFILGAALFIFFMGLLALQLAEYSECRSTPPHMTYSSPDILRSAS